MLRRTGHTEASIDLARLAGMYPAGVLVEIMNEDAEGYDTPVRERGANFSAGQRQLLSFARALVHGADILVLDEATSSIDTQTEALVQRGIRVLMEGRTAIHDQNAADLLASLSNSHDDVQQLITAFARD